MTTLTEQEIMRKIYKYEYIKEDKTRRKALPIGDKRQLLVAGGYLRRMGHFLAYQLRSGYKIFRLAIKQMKERYIKWREQ